jgi:hypothetical protein
MVAWMMEPTIPPPIDTPTIGRTRPATNAPTNTDHDVADQAEAKTLHDDTGKPAGDSADEKKDNQTLNTHDKPLRAENPYRFRDKANSCGPIQD